MNHPASLSKEVLSVYEKLPDLYLLISPDFLVITATDAYLKAMHLQRFAVIGKQLSLLFPDNAAYLNAQFRENFFFSLQEVIATKCPHSAERMLYKISSSGANNCKPKEQYWSFINTPVLDEKGEVTYIIHQLQEVTVQVKQELYIRQLEAQARFLPLLTKTNDPKPVSADLQNKTLPQWVFDITSSSFSILDTIWDEQGRAQDFEYQSADRISKAANPDMQLVGKRFSTVQSSLHQISLFNLLKEVAETGEERTVELHYVLAGAEHYCQVHGMKLEDMVVYYCEDITIRKNDEKKLQQEHRQLKEAQAIGHIGSFEWNYPDKTIYWSEELYRIYGLEPTNELITLDKIFQFTHPDDLEQLKAVVSQASQIKGAYILKHRIIRPDGVERHLIRRIQSWADTSSSVNNMSGTVQDITEQQLAESQLKEQTNFIRQVSATIPDMVSVIEIATGNLEFINRESLPVSGFTYEGLKDISREERRNLIHPDHRLAVKEYFSGFLSFTDDNVKTLEYQAKDHTVEWQWFLARGRVFRRNENGIPTHCINVVQNITQYKKAEEEKKHNLKILQQAEEMAGMGSWEYDIAAGVFRGSVGMYRLFGKKMGSKITPNIYLNHVLEEDRPVALKILHLLRTGQEPWEEIIRIKLKGHVKILKTKAIVTHNAEGKPVKIWGMDLDITEIKLLEKENLDLRLAQQKVLLLAILEAQEEERRRISENLHNGVGQILYATKIHLDLVNLQTKGQSLASLKEAKQKADELLLEAIRETRRVSHELIPLLLKEHGLEVAMEDFCCRFASESIKITSHGLKQRLENHLEIAIYRIAQELVNNIVKHAQATRARIEVFKEGNFIILEAQDDGKGLDTTQSAGKGIGLKTIQDRVALLEGMLEIVSTPGKGTLITISLPLFSIKNSQTNV